MKPRKRLPPSPKKVLRFFLFEKLKEDSIFDQRPEQLSVAKFLELTQKIAEDAVSDK